jgi:cell division protein FtsW
MGDGTPLNKSFLGPKRSAGQAVTARERRAARQEQVQGASGFRRNENGLPPDFSPVGEASQPVVKAASAGSAIRKPVSLGIDVPLLLIVAVLVILGMVMLFSASWKYSLDEYGNASTVWLRQMAWLGIALAAGIAASLIDYRMWTKMVIPLMIITLILLGAVLVVSDERHGAVRSLLSGSIQPSELAKLAIILYVSVWLYSHRDDLRSLSLGLFPLSLILGLVGALIAAQPDLSAVLTVGILGFILFFLAGGELRQVFFVMIGGGVIGGAFLRTGVFATGKHRWESFMAGLFNPLDASDHVQRSIEAFVRGGWFGVGIGKASSKLTALPFPHTDSIFAVIGEETGVVGASVLVLLFVLLLWRGLVIARSAPDMLGTLMASGLSFWIALEALVNMTVMVGLMPFAGNALPFVSAGGSNRVVSLIAIGILMNIARQSQQTTGEERTYHAFVNLRRRDWRGSVPRTRRS